MRYIALLLLIVGLSSGCAWSPTRDNPIDPKSNSYVEPPPPVQANRGPVIDTVFIITDCHKYVVSDFCFFEVHCRIHDLDQNLFFDSVTAEINLEPPVISLGRMNYDAVETVFFVRYNQNDFPGQTLNDLVGHPVTVRAVDDSGAVATHAINFPTPNTNFTPIVHPNFYETVNTVHPQLGWRPWDPSRDDYHYSISLLYKNIYSVWDTVNLPASDTSVVVTPALQTSETDPQLWYFWFLTVTDRFGNRMTSAPGSFHVIIPRAIHDPARPKKEESPAGIAEAN